MSKGFMMFYTTAFLEALGCLWTMKAWILSDAHTYTGLVYGVSSIMVLTAFVIFLTWHNASERTAFATYGLIYTLSAIAWIAQGNGMKLYAPDLVLIGIVAASWMTASYLWIRKWRRK